MPPADSPDLAEMALSEAAMGLGALAARLEPVHEGRVRLDGAEGWMQGRTMYGGAAASSVNCWRGSPAMQGCSHTRLVRLKPSSGEVAFSHCRQRLELNSSCSAPGVPE